MAGRMEGPMKKGPKLNPHGGAKKWGKDQLYIPNVDIYNELIVICKEQGTSVSKMLWKMVIQLIPLLGRLHKKGLNIARVNFKVLTYEGWEDLKKQEKQNKKLRAQVEEYKDELKRKRHA